MVMRIEFRAGLGLIALSALAWLPCAFGEECSALADELEHHEAACRRGDRAACRKSIDMRAHCGFAYPPRDLLARACRLRETYACGLAAESDGKYQLANRAYAQACDRRDAPACGRLARNYEFGRGVAKDEARAVGLLQKACDAGSSDDCVELGRKLSDGEGVAKNLTRALAIIRKACQAGDQTACATLGGMMDRLCDDTSADIRSSTDMNLGFCIAQDDPLACLGAGLIFLTGIAVPADQSRADSYFRRARLLSQKQCHQGDQTSCKIVKLLSGGQAHLANASKATALFRRVALLVGERVHGDVSVAVLVGQIKGTLEAVESETAEDLATKATICQELCDKGNGQACHQAALAYESGRGVSVDRARAAVLYQKACDAGPIKGCKPCETAQAGACDDLGKRELILSRRRVALKSGGKTAADVVKLFQRACDAGNRAGCLDLGTMYEEGLGVAKDRVRTVWLRSQEDQCEADEEPYCSQLAERYGKVDTRDPDQYRASDFRKMCDEGSVPRRGCAMAGVIYEDGLGVAKDDAQAAALYERACANHSWLACRFLAAMYEDGRGVAKDAARAAALYEKACMAGDERACKP